MFLSKDFKNTNEHQNEDGCEFAASFRCIMEYILQRNMLNKQQKNPVYYGSAQQRWNEREFMRMSESARKGEERVKEGKGERERGKERVLL